MHELIYNLGRWEVFSKYHKIDKAIWKKCKILCIVEKDFKESQQMTEKKYLQLTSDTKG